MQLYKVLISCEHGGRALPEAFQSACAIPESVLETHQGWDIGALALAQHIRDHNPVSGYIDNEMTRLLIDFNRSMGQPDLFSAWTKQAPAHIRIALLKAYRTYRAQVMHTIATWQKAGDAVCHLSVHSFTPIWQGQQRTCDIGILYDPACRAEVNFAQAFGEVLQQTTPWRVCHNAPYAGTDDGLTTTCRRYFPTGYIGIELETNQALWSAPETLQQTYRKRLSAAFQHALSTKHTPS